MLVGLAEADSTRDSGEEEGVRRARSSYAPKTEAITMIGMKPIATAFLPDTATNSDPR